MCVYIDSGQTPLHRAAGGGHTDTAALLLQHGAQIDSADKRYNHIIFIIIFSSLINLLIFNKIQKKKSEYIQ